LVPEKKRYGRHHQNQMEEFHNFPQLFLSKASFRKNPGNVIITRDLKKD